MAEGFGHADVPDPNKIVDFIEATAGSMMAVFEVALVLYLLDD